MHLQSVAGGAHTRVTSGRFAVAACGQKRGASKGASLSEKAAKAYDSIASSLPRKWYCGCMRYPFTFLSMPVMIERQTG